jgi:pimeloyl-ACP methyl ester carboxylesterase
VKAAMRFGRSLFLAATALAIGLSAPAPARAQDGPFRTYVQGRWGQIHVRVDGPQDGLVVVLVHKMVWSSVEFSKAQPVLARRGIRSIAIDLPGYGLSDSPDAQPTADEYADALLPVFDAHKVQKAVVVGPIRAQRWSPPLPSATPTEPARW